VLDAGSVVAERRPSCSSQPRTSCADLSKTRLDGGASCHPGSVRVVVDNSTGGDVHLAQSVAGGLRDRGFDVEALEPEPTSMFDTAVHVVSSGIVLRVDERPGAADLTAIEEVVRAALESHPSVRRRARAVPVAIGAGGQVLTWIDVFG
jgi:hypothetical protein